MAAWHSSTTAAVAAAPEGGPAAAPATTAGELATASAAVADEAVVPDESMLKSVWLAKMAESGVAAGAGDSAPGGGEGDQRQAALLESWKGYKRQFQQGVALFNQKPKKGVGYMQEQGLVGKAPDDVAQFLARTSGASSSP